MCSSPKGGSTKPLLSSHVDSLSSGMSPAEYTAMVQHANDSYEYRQEELKEYRKTHVNRLAAVATKTLRKETQIEKIRFFLCKFMSLSNKSVN